VLGFPIRTSSDPRSVDNSPRHIAASHVLHRLPVPRHPPCALTHLHTQKHPCMQTMQTIAYKNLLDKKLKKISFLLDARNHYPQLKHHTPPPKQGDNTSVLSQSPIVCLAALSDRHQPRPINVCCAPGLRHYSVRPLHGTAPTHCRHLLVVLLRKEVIQPHLPVRLPCYDFVPIADPTFDSSPHKG
jgi:hypothetical protein